MRSNPLFIEHGGYSTKLSGKIYHQNKKIWAKNTGKNIEIIIGNLWAKLLTTLLAALHSKLELYYHLNCEQNYYQNYE